MHSSSVSLAIAGLATSSWLAACASAPLAGEPPSQLSGDGVAGRPREAPPQLGRVDAQTLAQRVHERVNDVRLRHGLKRLAWNEALVAIAAGHSRDMQSRNYFAHVSPSGEDFQQRYLRGGFACRVPLAPGQFLVGGENLAQVQQVTQWLVWADGRREADRILTLDQLAEATVTGWWNSPPHKQNMLRAEWQTEAIGVVVAADGTVWVTQNFC